MSRRQLLLTGLACAVLAVLSVFVIDVPLARLIGPPGPLVESVAHGFISAIELVLLMNVSKFALGGALLAAGIVALLVRRWRAAAVPLLFVGATHLTARLIAGVLKNVFGRLRPLETASNVFFFPDGASMPSGHAVHLWALFFPLVLLFPRWRWILLPLPVLVSLARIAVSDHYLGDVIASMAIAALIAWAYALAPQIRRAALRPPFTSS